MRRYEIAEATGIDALAIVERPDPVPADGQVLIRVHAASLNYRDLVVVKGGYGRTVRLPLVPLSDGVGEVMRVGPNVTRVKPGDRVAGIFMQRWIVGEPDDEASRSALGGAIDGVLAEQIVLHQDGLVHVPDHLTDEEAATLPCASVTAWNALVTKGRIKPGETVLILGTGGVSIFALQFATRLGARVIATSSSDAKIERLRALGATDTINYTTSPAWDDEVRALTNRRGVDHVIEVGGAGTFTRSARAVRMGGRISLIGVLSGGREINFVPVFMRTLTVQGIYVGSREMFEEMNRFISEQRLVPVVDRVFGFEEAREAYRYLESGAHVGKVVIRLPH